MSSSTDTASQAEINRLKLELQALKVEDGSEQIMLAQLGVTSMFGLPGDFNLGFLDLVEDHPTIDWVGNCNELNAAYAADGFGRVKEQSIGVILTTFGVGELSATNGIAGAFSEMVPVLHIAGVPSTMQQKTKPMLHHTLGDGRYDAYMKVAEQFSVAQAYLTNPATAAVEIDNLLTECMTKARPVYLTLPTDIVYDKISSARLKIPLSVEAFVLDKIEELVKAADGNVVILLDACVVRHHARKETKELVRKTGFPVYAAPMGKTAINESWERFGGIYVGSISHPEIKEKIESAKLILSLGSLKSDYNSGNFTYRIPTARTVELHSSWTKVQYSDHPGIGMKDLLPKLTSRLEAYKSAALRYDVPPFRAVVPQEDDNIISQSWFWPTMAKFFRPKDVIVAETGTSNFGILDVPLPNDSILLNQVFWGSIGWSVGSCLGAALAAKDKDLGRVVLFVGDGSLQLTAQELSTMIRKDLKPIIFVLNNSGYTIERYIHGETRKYNDITNWKWTSLLETLGDLDGTRSKSYTTNTKEELSNLLDDSEFASANKIQLVEVVMPMHDAPRALKVQAELSGKTNAYTK
ncbi:thiamine diphosphate-binding protein [Desarmillaria tabescens]|uniref:Thiamine diphosphate-binding protein n=1 Tax=Armillaria tabescens TaxID=1929756 RepID=A0AA39NFH8_ARMTA|nr:thiamine diphosphate-binding protein [Desarmillaria tabescens]KAK0464686.1 thiamine diphosphate-binding protein [Desarmillaria tabescens]